MLSAMNTDLASPAAARRRSRRPSPLLGLAPLLLAGALVATAVHAAPADSGGNAARGQAFFNAQHGREWRCASCHGAVPLGAGRHAATGKAIEPLAPAANPQRLTDPAKVEKWFRRNCNDVLGRECSAGEKADVVAWLNALRP